MLIVTYAVFLPLSLLALYLAFSKKMRERALKISFIEKTETMFSGLDRWYWFLFVFIMVVGIFVRVYRFCELPKGTNQDGGLGALEAFYLMRDGVDTSGFSWPVYFEAWKYTNMSTLYSWMMIPIIRIWGNTVFSMRLPLLISSIIMLPVMWDLGRRMKGRNFGLLVLFLVATNPWQLIQSRWGIDANMAPHVFMLAIYLLYVGLDRKPLLFLSMIFFGLTVYAYGLAAFLVPAFLLPVAIYLVSRKKIGILSLAICIILFALVSGMFYWTMIINAFGLETVHIGPFTLPYLSDSQRSNDIAIAQKDGIIIMVDNMYGVLRILLHSNPENAPYDAIDWAHAMYRFMPVYYLFGVVWLWKMRRTDVMQKKDSSLRTYSLFILAYFVAAVFTGLQTGVMIMRINYVFYSLIMLSAYTIFEMGRRIKISAVIAVLMVGVSFIALSIDYFTNKDYQDLVGLNFRSGLFTALKETRGWDYDEYVIGVSSDTERKVVEPTVQYAHEIDYKAKNEESDLIEANGEHTEWYYSERYVYITDPDTFEPDPMNCNVYVMYKDKYADKFDETDFLLFDYDQYMVAYPKCWAE